MVDKTAIQYDLIFNTEAAQKDIASLVVQLKTAQDQLQKMGGSSGGAANGIKSVGQAAGQMKVGVQNAAFQVADFATQVNGGVSASRALAQQLPQLLGGMGALGAVAGGAVAVFLPLVSAMGDAMDASKRLAADTKALKDIQSEEKASLEDLTETYHVHAQTILEVKGLREALARINLAATLRDESAAIIDLNSGLADGVSAWTVLYNQLANADFSRSAMAQLFSQTTETNKEVNFLRDNFGLTEKAAAALVGPMRDLDNAQKNLNTDAAFLAVKQLKEQIEAGNIPLEVGIDLLKLFKERADALSQINPVTPAAMGFSFTPTTEATGYSDYKGEAVVAEQLAAIEKKLADSKKAVAEAAREAEAAQRAQENAYKSFVSEIERGITPLQRAKDQLQKLQEEFDKFGDRLSPEQLQQYAATVEDLNEKIDKLTFKDRWEKMAEGIQTLKTPLSELYYSLIQIGEAVTENLATGMTDAIMSLVEGTKSAKDAFKEFAVSFLKEITKMILKATILYMIQSALGLAGGGGGIGGFLTGLVGGGGGVGRSAGASLGRSSAMSSGETSLTSRSIPSLRSSGASSPGTTIAPALNVQVINNSNSSVSTGRDTMGNIRIMINDEVANALQRGGNKIDRALQAGYGLRRNGR